MLSGMESFNENKGSNKSTLGYNYISILYCANNGELKSITPPDFLQDLNIDQVMDVILKDKGEYNLEPVFWNTLQDRNCIYYRQEIFKDLENTYIMEHIKNFVHDMKLIRDYLEMVKHLDIDYNKKGWILEAILIYTSSIVSLTKNLSTAIPKSRGLSNVLRYLIYYTQSPKFLSLKTEAEILKKELSQIKYCIIFEGGRFKVKPYEGEEDYTEELKKIFEKFRHVEPKDYHKLVEKHIGMNHISGKILEFVAKLHPQTFARLDEFYIKYKDFMDQNIQRFDRELQFYLGYLDYISNIKDKGLSFCYPRLTTKDKEIFVRGGFDLALAYAHSNDQVPIVLNDFSLKGPERMIIVTGPNQGGKTTFARMFGQLHYLASLGCPVPGREALLFLFDNIFTHFEKREEISNLRGKLEDDIYRIYNMLSSATPKSIFLLNEIFSSTTVQDAIFLSKEIIHRIINLDALGVFVTFLDELASISDKTISMVALIDPEDPTSRTFKIVRQAPNGLAYALSLARKHGLTYEQIMERIP